MLQYIVMNYISNYLWLWLIKIWSAVKKKELLTLRNAWPKSAWRGDDSHSSLWQKNIQNIKSTKLPAHYITLFKDKKNDHNNIHRFYCCRVSKQRLRMHKKLRLVHVCRDYIHTCSLLYSLTTTGTLVGGICQS